MGEVGGQSSVCLQTTKPGIQEPQAVHRGRFFHWNSRQMALQAGSQAANSRQPGAPDSSLFQTGQVPSPMPGMAASAPGARRLHSCPGQACRLDRSVLPPSPSGAVAMRPRGQGGKRGQRGPGDSGPGLKAAPSAGMTLGHLSLSSYSCFRAEGRGPERLPRPQGQAGRRGRCLSPVGLAACALCG